MNIKLSALALGITLAYGVNAAMATDETPIYQTGWYSDASIEQYKNVSVKAMLNESGFDNESVIAQEKVINGDAWVDQNSSNLKTTIAISTKIL